MKLKNTVKTAIAFVLVGLIALSASARERDRDRDRNGAKRDGTIIGGVLGAIIGAEVGDDVEGAIIGGVVGAAAGRAIGDDIDDSKDRRDRYRDSDRYRDDERYGDRYPRRDRDHRRHPRCPGHLGEGDRGRREAGGLVRTEVRPASSQRCCRTRQRPAPVHPISAAASATRWALIPDTSAP